MLITTFLVRILKENGGRNRSKKMGGSDPTGRVGISGIEKWVLKKNKR